RPIVKAQDRLISWSPLNGRTTLDSAGQPVNISKDDLEAILTTIISGLASSTRATYSTGLLNYHILCDYKNIPEDQRSPTSPVLIATFVSALFGLHAGSTVRNYVMGVQAWHIIHGVTWRMNTDELELLLKAAEREVLKGTRSKKRQPWTIEYMLAIRNQLNLTNPLHVAVWACLLTVFFTCSRLGEFTLRTLKSFNAAIHIMPAHVRAETDREGRKSTIFTLPRSKADVAGEEVSFRSQTGDIDPESALDAHRQLNSPPANGPLFAYLERGKPKPLTKSKFLEVVHQAAISAGLEKLQGHGIRIGSTLEYLLRGVPFDVVKVKGRWASDAFLVYLRKHAQILAPYMQDRPEVHEAFVRIAMPPVRR
ncbi:hypothetical protein BKA70DRAFT_1113585, partial [Coprinopsis sp. MPI-PUGE-AT-0042]